MNIDEQQGSSSPAQADAPTLVNAPNQPDLLQVPPIVIKKRPFAPSPSKPTAPAKKLAADFDSQSSPKPTPFAAATPQNIDDLFTRPSANTQGKTSFAPRPLLFKPLPNRQRDMLEKNQTELAGKNTEEGRNEADKEAERPGTKVPTQVERY